MAETLLANGDADDYIQAGILASQVYAQERALHFLRNTDLHVVGHVAMRGANTGATGRETTIYSLPLINKVSFSEPRYVTTN